MTWSKVDWNKSNVEIAEELGVSRQRVHQKREAMGIPPVNPKGAVEAKIRRWLKKNNPREYTIRGIARSVGCSPSAVLRYRDIYGLNN